MSHLLQYPLTAPTWRSAIRLEQYTCYHKQKTGHHIMGLKARLSLGLTAQHPYQRLNGLELRAQTIIVFDFLFICCCFRPLNSIGVPYFDSQLLSAWPSNLHTKSATYPPPAKIPPQILSTMKYNQNIAYASLPKELRGRRNMTTAEPRKGGARFRSGKASSDEVRPISKFSRRTSKF